MTSSDQSLNNTHAAPHLSGRLTRVCCGRKIGTVMVAGMSTHSCCYGAVADSLVEGTDRSYDETRQYNTSRAMNRMQTSQS